MAYQYLTFFLDDDEELERIHREYGAGRMLTRDVKERLVQILQKIVKDHQVGFDGYSWLLNRSLTSLPFLCCRRHARASPRRKLTTL